MRRIFNLSETAYSINRNSSIESLRIIAILIIITHHFGYHGVLKENILTVANLNWQIVFTQLVSWGGNLGNMIFMMITGYYMINANVKKEKILLLLFTMLLYSWVIEIVSFYIIGMSCSIDVFVKNTFPIWFGLNWFVSCYIIFSTFIPFVNKFLLSLDNRQYLYLLLLLFIFQSLLPTLGGVTFMNKSQFIFFGFGYAIGGYLRLYFQEYLREEYKQKYIFLFTTFSLMIVLSIFLLDFLGIYLHIDKFVFMASRVGGGMIFTVPISVSIFCLFLSIKPFNNYKINIVAQTVLGVYLIHDNSLMRQILWNQYFPNLNFIDSIFYPIFYIVKVLLVFLVCVCVEYLRKIYIEPRQVYIVDIILKKFIKIYYNLVSRIQLSSLK